MGRDNRGNLQRQPNERSRPAAALRMAPEVFHPLVYARFNTRKDIEKFVTSARDIVGDKRFQDITGLELEKVGTNQKVRAALLSDGAKENREKLCVLTSITMRGRRPRPLVL